MGNKKTLSTFQLIFVGEFIEIVADLIGGAGESGMPLVISGFLLDIDDEYFYMGKSHDEVDQAIRKDNVIFICIIQEKDEIKEALRSVPTPKNKDEGN